MSRPSRYGALTERVGAIKRILSIKGLPFGRRKASDDSVFFDQYPGQWSAETAPREALVANADWSASPNPGLLEGGFDYYPRAEEEWAGQQREQRSFARDMHGQRVPRFCLTDSWEDLPGTLAGMQAFSTALETGMVMVTSFSASSAVSAQLDGREVHNEEERQVDELFASTSSDEGRSKRMSVGSSAGSFEFSPCTSGRTSMSSLPSALPTNLSDDVSADDLPKYLSITSQDKTPLLHEEAADKGKTPIRTVEEAPPATIGGRPAVISPMTIVCSVGASEASCYPTFRDRTAEVEEHNEMHLSETFDCSDGSWPSPRSMQYSYTDSDSDEEEEEHVRPRVLRVINVD